MNISEVYIDARETYKKDPPSHAAFSKVINNKFRAFDQDREYPTVEFATKAYYNEAVKLSERPWAYQTEKINPIQKFIPVNFDTLYSQAKQSLNEQKKAFFSSSNSKQDVEESLQPNADSNKMTFGDINETIYKTQNLPPLKIRDTAKEVSKSPEKKGTDIIYGSSRHLELTSSRKKGIDITKPRDGGKPAFVTNFKIPDRFTLKAMTAKAEPIVDPYYPHKNHKFRDIEQKVENKEQFVLSWKPEIPNHFKNENEWDHRPQAVLLKEAEEKYQKHLKELGVTSNPNPWVKHFRQASRERGFVDHQLPQFNDRGEYVDGYMKGLAALRGEVEFEVPFKLFHRTLRKTDKNLFLGEAPSKL